MQHYQENPALQQEHTVTIGGPIHNNQIGVSVITVSYAYIAMASD